MPEQPLVSVITAFYNPGSFLHEAIASVHAQTYANWEYLLVNDGSNDGNQEVARTAAAADSARIHFWEHPSGVNRGVCPSRNLGLQNARGKYIAILDADDVWFPNKLQEQVFIAEQHANLGLLFGNSEYWYSWTGKAKYRQRDHIPPLAPGDRIYEPGELLPITYPLGKFGAPCPTSALINRELFCNIGGFEEGLNRHLYEDQTFLSKLYLSTRVYVSNSCWDRYRIHDDSFCAVATRAGLAEPSRREYMDWLREYLVSHDVSAPEIWAAWNHATLRYRHPLLFGMGAYASKLRRGLRQITGDISR